MKSGFELLKTRQVEDILNVEYLESKYSIKLPPLYKVFMQTFDVDAGLYSEKFSQNDGTVNYAATSFCGEDIEGVESFAGFSSLELALSVMVTGDVEFWSNNKYIPIGDAFHGHGAILVGTQPNVQDQIFLHNDEFDECTKIYDNIFEFVKSIFLEYEFYSDVVDHSKLYRTWNNKIWKLKPIE